MALPRTSFFVPPSSETVKVRIIDTTSRIDNFHLDMFFPEKIPGYTTFGCPSFSFLIEHPSGRSLLFDLGIDKNWRNLAPAVLKVLDSLEWEISVKKNVRDILEENGVDASKLEAVIWSHWHWDHTGDPSTFDPNTALIVGPGFKEAFVPGYPKNPDAYIRESDYEGRELREVNFESGLQVGRFNAIDYFNDGSFYLLDAPGHTIGHLCALARVTSSPPTFIFMGADACHHAAEFRPSKNLPLPNSIIPHPFEPKSTIPCPGALFEPILRDGNPAQPIFSMHPPPKSSAHDHEAAEETIVKLGELDADDAVLTVIAHDDTISEIIDLFPLYANDFQEKGWAKEHTWRFLKDFEQAVTQKDEIDN